MPFRRYVVAPGPNHRMRSVDGGFGTARRPFPTVINEGGALINDILLELSKSDKHNVVCRNDEN